VVVGTGSPTGAGEAAETMSLPGLRLTADTNQAPQSSGAVDRDDPAAANGQEVRRVNSWTRTI
jgi:hypothetical protein